MFCHDFVHRQCSTKSGLPSVICHDFVHRQCWTRCGLHINVLSRLCSSAVFHNVRSAHQCLATILFIGSVRPEAVCTSMFCHDFVHRQCWTRCCLHVSVLSRFCSSAVFDKLRSAQQCFVTILFIGSVGQGVVCTFCHDFVNRQCFTRCGLLISVLSRFCSSAVLDKVRSAHQCFVASLTVHMPWHCQSLALCSGPIPEPLSRVDYRSE